MKAGFKQSFINIMRKIKVHSFFYTVNVIWRNWERSKQKSVLGVRKMPEHLRVYAGFAECQS